jgi:hypothetical protein
MRKAMRIDVIHPKTRRDKLIKTIPQGRLAYTSADGDLAPARRGGRWLLFSYSAI